jgi:hypothetical protein
MHDARGTNTMKTLRNIISLVLLVNGLVNLVLLPEEQHRQNYNE